MFKKIRTQIDIGTSFSRQVSLLGSSLKSTSIKLQVNKKNLITITLSPMVENTVFRLGKLFSCPKKVRRAHIRLLEKIYFPFLEIYFLIIMVENENN